MIEKELSPRAAASVSGDHSRRPSRLFNMGTSTLHRTIPGFPVADLTLLREILGKLLIPCCVLIFWFSASAANALDPNEHISQYGHTAWHIQDGVFPGIPHVLAQTADGYVWIGTETGLVRFDGVRFVPWVPPAGQRLPAPNVYSLLGGRDGSLWIGTGGALARWKDGELQSYTDAPGRINAIIEDQEGAVWMVRSRFRDEKGTLCRVDGRQLRCYGKADGISCVRGDALAEDTSGNLWIGDDAGLCRWKASSSATYLTPRLKHNEGLFGVDAIAPLADGSLWVGTSRSGAPGLGLQRLVDGRWQDAGLHGKAGAELQVTSLFVDRDKMLWGGTDNKGIFRLRGGVLDRFAAEDGLSGNTVEALLQDREGNIWISTTKGIDMFRDLHVASISMREGLTDDAVSSVLASRDGTVWIGNLGSLDRVRGNEVSAIRTRDGLPGQSVTSLLEDHAGRLWVGVDNGLTVYEKGRFTPINEPDGRPVGVVTDLTEDVDQNVWAQVVGSFGRPPRLVRIRDRRVAEEIDPAVVPRTTVLAADPRGGLWLGLFGGNLGRYRDGKLETIHLMHGTEAGAYDLLADSGESVWAATRGGVIRWKEGKQEVLNSRNGLPCDFVYAVIKDDLGSLWTYGECGVSVIRASELERWWTDPEAVLEVTSFDSSDGALPGVADFKPAASKSADGRLWFANNDILQVIDPSRLAFNRKPPPVRVEQVLADHKSFSLGQGLRLPRLTRNLEIDYTALSFVIPQKVKFRYKLEGHDSTWQEAGTRRQAFYNDLPPGDYRFRVIASNNDGVWNEEGATLGFSILPAFYQTSWFLLLCVTAAGWLAWAAYRWRMRQLATRLDLQFRERLSERARVAQDLHDTLLQDFLSASLQLQVADAHLPAGSRAKPIVGEVLDLMRSAIEGGRKAVRGLRSWHEETRDLTEAFSRIPQELAMPQEVGYRVTVEGQPRPLHPLVRDEVYRIGREALVNAFRHSGARSIEVELQYATDQLRTVVRDDGCGIDPRVLHTGREGHWGLSGMRERAERIGAKLKVSSRPAGGTEVELSVPNDVAFRSYSPNRFGWLSRRHPRKAEPSIHGQANERKS